MNKRFIGVLSGTSMDAVDVGLVEFIQNKAKLVSAINYPIPEAFRDECLAISETGNISIDRFCKLNAKAGILFADAVLALLKQTEISPNDISGIGSHGQNLRHRPNDNPPFSLQIGDPNIIVAKTGIPTIANFRSRDVAAGGQGAPLAPGFHEAVFRETSETRVIVNIGGISNITWLPADPTLPVLGFDTGPGNCLMDAWIKQHLKQAYDKGGVWAGTGTVQEALLEHCLSDPYFEKTPPKSTGREYFHLEWLSKNIKASYANKKSIAIAPQDIQATLLALTAHTIANAILQLESIPAKIFVCGGGIHNKFLMETLSCLLNRDINSTEILGISPDWVEAMLFAWLAKQTLEGKPGNCPAVTGAKDAAVLGGIYGYRYSGI